MMSRRPSFPFPRSRHDVPNVTDAACYDTFRSTIAQWTVSIQLTTHLFDNLLSGQSPRVIRPKTSSWSEPS